MRQTNVKRAIEAQRVRLDRKAERASDLTTLLEEAKEMDRLIEVYESRKTTA